MIKREIVSSLVFALSIWTLNILSANAQVYKKKNNSITFRIGPLQPNPGGVTRAPALQIPKQYRPYVYNCKVTSFNGIPGNIEITRFVVYNVPVVRGALFVHVTCLLRQLGNIEIFPKNIELTRYGQTVQLVVRAPNLSIKREQVVSLVTKNVDLGPYIKYINSNPKVVSVSYLGVVRALSSGTAQISAVIGGKQSKPITVRVKLPQPIGIFVRPERLFFTKIGEVKLLNVFPLYRDALPEKYLDLKEVKLSIEDPSVVKKHSSGIGLIALKEGRTTVTVTYRNLTAKLSAVVKPKARLVAIRVLPKSISFKAKGQLAQLAVFADYSDGAKVDITGGVSGIVYRSSNPKVASVSKDGLVMALSSGKTDILVSHPALPGKVEKVSVSSNIPTLQSISVSPKSILIRKLGDSVQLNVTAHYRNGSSANITRNGLIKYLSGDEKIASVSPSGSVTAVGFGKTNITVNYEGKSLTIPVEVLERQLVSIEVVPKTLKLEQNLLDFKGVTYQLKVIGKYDDNTTKDLTKASTGTTYKSGNTNVATVTPDGLVIGSGRNTQPIQNTTITVENKGKKATVSVQIRILIPRQVFWKPLTPSGLLSDIAAIQGRLLLADLNNKQIFNLDLNEVNKGNFGKDYGVEKLEGKPKSILPAGNVFFASTVDRGLLVYSFIRPKFPKKLGELPLNFEISEGKVRNDRIYLSAGSKGIAVVDISKLNSPKLLGTTNFGNIRELALSESWLAAVGKDRVLIYNYRSKNWWNSPPAQTISIKDVVSIANGPKDGVFYAAARKRGLYLIRSTGTFTKLPPFPNSQNAVLKDFLSVSTEGDWLMASGGVNEVAFYYLGNPDNPQYRYRFALSLYSSSNKNLFPSRGYIYALNTSSGKHFIAGFYRKRYDHLKNPPKITLNYPPDNGTIDEDEEIHFEVEASDDGGIDRVEFFLDGRKLGSVNHRPFRFSFPAPNVTQTSKFLLRAVAYDTNGNRKESNPITLNVRPIQDNKPPSGEILFPYDGMEIEIGASTRIEVSAKDDVKVAAVRLFVNGKSVASLSMPPFVFDFQVPTGASDGQKFTFFAEIEDYGGNKVKTATVTLTAVTLIEVTKDILASNKNFDNKRILIKGKNIKIDGFHQFKSLWIDKKGSVTIATTAEKGGKFSIKTDYLYISSDSKLEVVGKGYLGKDMPGAKDQPSRNCPNTPHGGYTYSDGCPIYGSPFEPRWAGGGAGNYRGGGIIEIEAKSIVVDGIIDASGSTSRSSGGSVFIRSVGIYGKGRIKAEGQSGGGGGRIAIIADKLGIDVDNISAASRGGGHTRGLYPSAGTIFLKRKGQKYGELIIDGKLSGKARHFLTPLPSVGKGTITSITSDTLEDTSANWRPGDLVGFWVQPNPARKDKIYRIKSNTKTKLTLDMNGEDLRTVTSAGTEYRGVLRLDKLIVKNRGFLGVSDRVVADAVIVDGNSVISPLESEFFSSGSVFKAKGITGPSIPPPLELKVDRLEIRSGSAIAADGAGFRTSPDGKDVLLGGGAYGGLGGVTSNSINKPGLSKSYGSIFGPNRPGSGSQYGKNYIGGNGGGFIKIEANSILLDGEIRADGAEGLSYNSASRSYVPNGYCGSGGGILIRVKTLSGKGTISASSSCRGRNGAMPGGGGGGRIAIYYDSMAKFPLAQLRAYGAQSKNSNYYSAGAGTIFLKQTSQKYGMLVVDNGGTKGQIPVRETVLPAVGVGNITGLTADSITDKNAQWEPGSLVGHWVYLKNKFYLIRENSSDTLKLDTQGADLTQTVKVGDRYEGYLFFDELIVRNNAKLYSRDKIVLTASGSTLSYSGAYFASTELKLAPNSSLSLDDTYLELGSGTFELNSLILQNNSTISVRKVGRGETPNRLFLKVKNRVSIDSTSKIDVSGKGYPGGVYRPNDIAAGTGYTYPNTLQGGAKRGSGGSHGGFGRFTFSKSALGKIYNSFFSPSLPGAGGSCNSQASSGSYTPFCYGGYGGGAVRIQAADLVLDGKILANGVSPRAYRVLGGGGAGGSVWIEAQKVSGKGTVEANGGGGKYPGGGGRIAFFYGQLLSNFDPYSQLKALPGGAGAAAGTVFIKKLGTSKGIFDLGDLIVDQNSVSRGQAATELVSISSGTITSLDRTKLSITDSSKNFADKGQLRGLWIEFPSISSGNKLYFVDNNDRTTLFLKDPAGVGLPTGLFVGAAYKGVVRLNQLILKGGAQLVTVDLLQFNKKVIK